MSDYRSAYFAKTLLLQKLRFHLSFKYVATLLNNLELNRVFLSSQLLIETIEGMCIKVLKLLV